MKIQFIKDMSLILNLYAKFIKYLVNLKMYLFFECL